MLKFRNALGDVSPLASTCILGKQVRRIDQLCQVVEGLGDQVSAFAWFDNTWVQFDSVVGMGLEGDGDLFVAEDRDFEPRELSCRIFYALVHHDAIPERSFIAVMNKYTGEESWVGKDEDVFQLRIGDGCNPIVVCPPGSVYQDVDERDRLRGYLEKHRKERAGLRAFYCRLARRRKSGPMKLADTDVRYRVLRPLEKEFLVWYEGGKALRSLRNEYSGKTVHSEDLLVYRIDFGTQKTGDVKAMRGPLEARLGELMETVDFPATYLTKMERDKGTRRYQLRVEVLPELD